MVRFHYALNLYYICKILISKVTSKNCPKMSSAVLPFEMWSGKSSMKWNYSSTLKQYLNKCTSTTEDTPL